MDMTVMRGTTIPIVLSLTDSDTGEPISLQGEQALVFRIKNNPNAQGYMYQKVCTSAYEQSPGLYAFKILPSETETWPYGTYYYDYGIQFAVNDYHPCISTSKFIVVESIAGRVNSSDIVYTEIENGSVTTIKIKDGAVTLAKLNANVTAAALGGAAAEHNHNDLYYSISEIDSKFAGLKFDSSKIEDKTISTEKLEDTSVTAAKLASNAVTAAKIASGAVTAAKIAAGAVSTYYTGTSGAEWAGSEAPYTTTVSVSGLLTTDHPILDLKPSADLETAQSQIDAWGNVYRAEVTAANTLTLYSTVKSDIALPVQMLCVRK